MANQVVHYEIRTGDPDAARTFYGELFGWTFPPGAEPGYSYIEAGGPIPGGIGQGAPGSGLVTFFVGVDSVEETLQTVERMGGKVVRPATSVPGVTFGLFADPQGNIIGLAHQD